MKRYQRTRWLYALLVLMLIGLTLTGCSLQLQEPVTLGAVYSLTGDQAGLDAPSAAGAQLAIAQANERGGVLHRPVALVIRDGETDPTVVAQVTGEIIEQHPQVAAIFGLSDTDLVQAATVAAAAQDRLFLTSGATSPKLPAVAPGYLFLACFGDNVQAAAGAEWAYQTLGAHTAVILYREGSTYTELLQGYFKTRFTEMGGRILATETYTLDDDASLAAASERLPTADIVYLAATPGDALPAVQALRAAAHDEPILGGDGLDVADVWTQHPDISQVYYTTHAYLGADNDAPQVVAFRDAFIAMYPDETPDAFAALGYDAANLLLAAIDKAGSSQPDAVRRALADLHQFDGVTGQMYFPADSQIPIKSVSLLAVDAGTIRLAEQVMPVQVPAP